MNSWPIAVKEIAARQPVATIVEPQAGAASFLRPCLNLERLGPVHVRAVSAQKCDACTVALKAAIGQPFTAANLEIVCLRQTCHPFAMKTFSNFRRANAITPSGDTS